MAKIRIPMKVCLIRIRHLELVITIQELMNTGNKLGTGTACVNYNYNKFVLNLPGKEIVDLHQHFPRKCGHPLSDIKNL